jgi:hypothetical protein
MPAAGITAGEGWKLSGALISDPGLACGGADAGSSTLARWISFSSVLTPYMAVSSISSAPGPKCSHSEEKANDEAGFAETGLALGGGGAAGAPAVDCAMEPGRSKLTLWRPCSGDTGCSSEE